jgi:serine/threonine protein kinase
VLSLR